MAFFSVRTLKHESESKSEHKGEHKGEHTSRPRSSSKSERPRSSSKSKRRRSSSKSKRHRSSSESERLRSSSKSERLKSPSESERPKSASRSKRKSAAALESETKSGLNSDAENDPKIDTESILRIEEYSVSLAPSEWSFCSILLIKQEICFQKFSLYDLTLFDLLFNLSESKSNKNIHTCERKWLQSETILSWLRSDIIENYQIIK